MKKKKTDIYKILLIAVLFTMALNVIYVIAKMRRESIVIDPRSYQIDIKGDSMDVYDGNRKVGKLVIDSTLSKLITEDN